MAEAVAPEAPAFSVVPDVAFFLDDAQVAKAATGAVVKGTLRATWPLHECRLRLL